MSRSAAAAQLSKAFRKVKDEPVEGVFVDLVNDNLFEWKCFVEGPKDTPYHGGIFQALLTFPDDYPMMPPKLQFLSDFWHPNVYPDGKVCISILHPPVDDDMSGEHISERWRPTHTPSSVLLSVVSMLSDPNTSSPANVDASVEWRDRRKQFEERVSKLAEKARKACPDNIKIPHPDTDPEERERAIRKIKMLNEEDNWMDDGMDDVDDGMDEEEEEADFLEEDSEPMDDDDDDDDVIASDADDN